MKKFILSQLKKSQKRQRHLESLAKRTRDLLSSAESEHYGFFQNITNLFGCVSVIIALIILKWVVVVGVVALMLLVRGINHLVVRKKHQKSVYSILRQDRKDLALSKELSKILDVLKGQEITEFGTIENAIGSQWKPYRVEYLMGSSIRGKFQGSMKLDGGLLMGASNGTMDGSLEGKSIPKLIDSSTIIFLTNNNENDEKTLRVLIPNSDVVIDFIQQKLESLSSADSIKDSHVESVLKFFSKAHSLSFGSLIHPEVIDKIDLSCRNPIDERPSIVVYGEQVQNAVAFATAIGVDGVKNLFYPSGFFKELVTKTQPYINGLTQIKIRELVGN